MSLVFCVKGMEKNVFLMLTVVYYFVVLDFSLYWCINIFGTVVLNGGVTSFKVW